MKIILPIEIKLKGQCKGITTVQIERTHFKALYKRSDNYWECFYIKEVKERIKKDGTWIDTGNTIEYYPKEEDFGYIGYCGKESKIRSIYESLNEDNKVSSFNNLKEYKKEIVGK